MYTVRSASIYRTSLSIDRSYHIYIPQNIHTHIADSQGTPTLVFSCEREIYA